MKVRQIVTEAVSIERDRREEAERHEKAVKTLNARLAAVQRLCPHPLTTHHGDPAGGSDSWDECDLCGANVRREETS